MANPALGRALLQVHIAVALFGLSGLAGKWLDLPATTLVLGRTAFAAMALGLLLGVRRQGLWPRSWADGGGLALLGVLLAVHWVSFFRSIQLASVAVGLLTFSSFPVFVALLAPLLGQGRWRWADGLLALGVGAGVALVVPNYRWGTAAMAGALWGLGAGLSFALLQVLNRGYRQRYGAGTIALHQNLWACLSLLLVVPLGDLGNLGGVDWAGLMGLGVFCTALAHTLFIESLAVLRAQTASLISGLEPVYGVGLAALVLGEVPSLRTVVGGAIIVAATALASVQGEG